jgi:hypothetical protein
MNDGKFEVYCNARNNGHLRARTRALSAAVSQVIERNPGEEMWQSLLVICEEGEDGSLTAKIIVCHPDWDPNPQLAPIRSCVPCREKRRPRLQVDLKSTRL